MRTSLSRSTSLLLLLALPPAPSLAGGDPLGACCHFNESGQDCLNLTQAECEAQPPVEAVREWQEGQVCGYLGQICPVNACMERTGACTIGHPPNNPGCSDSICCTDICLHSDSFCCLVHWDHDCAFFARYSCELGTCCEQPPNSSAECADGIREEDCSGAYRVWTEGRVCSQDPCEFPVTGACCNTLSAECVDDQPLSQCTSEHQIWHGDTLCAAVQCDLARGSCCDGTPGLGGVCTPNVLQSECIGTYKTWTNGGFCSLFTCQEATGACCESLFGECDDGRTERSCDGNREAWHPLVTCDEVTCLPDAGACCDQSPGVGGLCTDGARLPDCFGSFLVWAEDTPCSKVECDEYVAACCDSLDGVCRLTLMEDCQGDHDTWYVHNHCDTISCEPSVGACCDHGTADPATATCAQSTRLDCNCEKCEWFEDQDCAAVLCDPNFVPVPTASTWGMLILGLAALAAGKVAFSTQWGSQRARGH